MLLQETDAADLSLPQSVCLNFGALPAHQGRDSASILDVLL